jgi:hypothetical protein
LQRNPDIIAALFERPVRNGDAANSRLHLIHSLLREVGATSVHLAVRLEPPPCTMV